jgi:hypothetical protein
MTRILLFALFVGLIACSSNAPAPSEEHAADVVVEWNQRLLAAAEAEDGFLTLKGLRAAAMMHLAIHDSLVMTGSPFEAFVCDSPIGQADPIAAASQAAFEVAIAQYPDRHDEWTALNERWLAKRSKIPSLRITIDLARHCAQSVMATRSGDGWNTEAEYTWHPMAPGVYAEFRDHSGTPEGFVFGRGWSLARGFALSAPDQFRSPPPPPIASDRYARAFDEVKESGRDVSRQRTSDQTHLALWWKDFVENSHNRLARDLVSASPLDLAAANRLFALLNMSIFDAYISAFDNKFFYNHWRPYTAIRWAANDGNPDTLEESNWNNTHGHTYAFPSYPSAHGTACAAAMAAIADTFGDDVEFVMRTPLVDIAGPLSGKMPMTPPTREFASFSQAAEECALSRVYLGIHFRYDSEQGTRLGQRVGTQVVNTMLKNNQR